MELKELKKEIDRLPDLNKTLLDFQSSWLRQLRPHTNPLFPFLQELDLKTKKGINALLSSYPPLCRQLKYSQFTQEKLSALAQYLIELKVASLNGDTHKPRIIINKFIHDDFLNLKQLVDETRQFEFNLHCLKQLYHQTHKLLLPQLPLEHSIAFLDSPHKNHLNLLLLASKKQKQLLKILGKEFVSLAREMKRKKKL